MGQGTEHPGILYFYSESIALTANGCCAFVAALSNFGVVQRGTSSIGLWFLIIGGIAQLLCALRAYRAYDHFGATAFAFYSAFWGILGLEIIQATSINLLHICFVAVGILLTLIAPIINGFYPILLASITVASSLELALRVDDSNALKTAAAVSELCVVAATIYGCVAALLHGVHERQVFPGFDDALIETVLWKRNALKSSYSDGKYANPAPLGNVCCSLGYAGLVYQIHGALQAGGLTIWFATVAVLCGFVSLLHTARHERLLSVSTMCDACLFAAAASATVLDGSERAGIMITFAAFRLFLVGFAIVENFALMYIVTFIVQVVSLFAIGAASYVLESDSAVTGAIVVGCMASISATYVGMAELTNSVAQKELLPTGQDWNCISCDRPIAIDEESGTAFSNGNGSTGIGKSIRRVLLDVTSHSHSMLGMDSERSSFVAKSTHKLKSKLLMYKNDNPDEGDNEVSCPGDTKLMGKSDFQSPLFVMTIGTAVYSILMSIVVFTNSIRCFEEGVVLLATQSASLLISLSRGQTSYGFLCFTYLLESMLLMNGSYVPDNSKSMVGIVAVLQVLWLLASFHVFRLLSIATCAHAFALVFYAISAGINGDASGLRYTSGVAFAITSLFDMITLGILLCSNKSTFCRWILQSSAAETEGRCDIGFASNRDEFDRCVQILRSGGVCCIPTDTVYCLACAANSPEAIKRIYDIKNRPSEKPLSLWLGSIDDIRSVAPEGKGWTSKLFAFMDVMWPGSVSLVVSRGSWLQRMGVGDAADLIGTEDSIALRVPNSTLTVALLKETGPLAITSANPSGACDCTHHNKVDDVIASKIDYILADGPSPMTIASSVIDVRNVEDNELHFYRVGCVPESYVWKKLNQLEEKSPTVLADISNTNIAAIQSFMSQITRLVGCETYKLHALIRTPDKKDDTMAITSWKNVSPRIKSAFVSGVSFYDGDGNDSSQDEAQSSEMIAPLLNSHGEVCAVLQLLCKTSDGSNAVPFKADDLRYSGIVSALVYENLPIEQSEEEIDFGESVSVIALTENGLHMAKQLVGTSTRPSLAATKSKRMSMSFKSMRNLSFTHRSSSMSRLSVPRD